MKNHRGKQENDELILLELLHQNLNWYVNMRCLSWNWKCSSPNERILTIGLLMARHTFASISASSWWWEFSLTVEAQSSHQNDDEDYAASPHAMQSQVFNKLTRFSPVIWNKLIMRFFFVGEWCRWNVDEWFALHFHIWIRKRWHITAFHYDYDYDYALVF